MKNAPCKNCTDRQLACHDSCKKYKDWKDYLFKTKQRQRQDKSFRSYATDKNTLKESKKKSAVYMRNKF